MANSLYNKENIIGILFQYFNIYFAVFPKPTAESLFLLVLSILALESADSIRFLYRHFLSKITTKSLNAFYYALFQTDIEMSVAKADHSKFMNITVRLALRLIPENLRNEPVFLCIGDTIVPKSGIHFEEVSILYDHAAHSGSNYLNGHCFVSLMLCIPVWNGRRITHLSVPLGYQLLKKECTKLELRRVLYRSPQGNDQSVWQPPGLCLCDSIRENHRYPKAVLLHGFTRIHTACMRMV